MRRLLTLVLVFCLAAAAGAADAPKPNTLTPKEIADGWILLWDGETTFGWRSPNDSQWTITDGILAPQADKPGLLVTTSPFRDYKLVFEYQVKMDGDGGVHMKPAAGDVGKTEVRRDDNGGRVLVGCDAQGHPDDDNNGRRDSLGNRHGTNPWNHAELEVRGGLVTGVEYTAPGAIPATEVKPDLKHEHQDRSGYIALTGNNIVFRNIKLQPTNTQPLFNGKDLSGWKEYPGKKSKFSVTNEGTIHLEGGPGDLQTDSQWADFVLQLNCISNGDHCNSGVFVRCIPSEFENGYEAQIRNEFTAEPQQEYAIEEYDPKTHELKDTKKEKYAAVDYGTGGIYRRAPARKELSKDREWFGMTIVASDRHIATWVNGVQAADWTDERPLADNPRKGCRLEKGAISLQGHEAATEDLDFRDIRIQDLAPAEETKPEKKEP